MWGSKLKLRRTHGGKSYGLDPLPTSRKDSLIPTSSMGSVIFEIFLLLLQLYDTGNKECCLCHVADYQPLARLRHSHPVSFLENIRKTLIKLMTKFFNSFKSTSLLFHNNCGQRLYFICGLCTITFLRCYSARSSDLKLVPMSATLENNSFIAKLHD